MDLGVTKGALRSLSDAEGQRIGEMLRKGGVEFGKDLPPLRPGFPTDFGAQTLRTTVGDVANINKGLTDLRRAREFYAKGINRFDDAVVEKIYAESKKGSLIRALLLSKKPLKIVTLSLTTFSFKTKEINV